MSKASKIKLYSTKSCPWCVMEKQWLESINVNHEVVYVDENQEEAVKMVKETGQMGVPVTEIKYENGEKEYIVGFDKNRLATVLNVKN